MCRFNQDLQNRTDIRPRPPCPERAFSRPIERQKRPDGVGGGAGGGLRHVARAVAVAKAPAQGRLSPAHAWRADVMCGPNAEG